MKIWIDEIPTPIPEGYAYWCKNVKEAKHLIKDIERYRKWHWKKYAVISTRTDIEVIDINKDIKDDKFFKWLKKKGRNYNVSTH